MHCVIVNLVKNALLFCDQKVAFSSELKLQYLIVLTQQQ